MPILQQGGEIFHFYQNKITTSIAPADFGYNANTRFPMPLHCIVYQVQNYFKLRNAVLSDHHSPLHAG